MGIILNGKNKEDNVDIANIRIRDFDLTPIGNDGSEENEFERSKTLNSVATAASKQMLGSTNLLVSFGTKPAYHATSINQRALKKWLQPLGSFLAIIVLEFHS